MSATKKYRVNESEHFNLMSMYDHLKAREIMMQEDEIPWEDDIEEKIEEVERLMEEAYCVGALVEWPTLKRIREIKDERQNIRYANALTNGASEADAAYAFQM